MTQDEITDLIPHQSFVTYKNADDKRVIARVLIVVSENEIHLQLYSGREIVKASNELKYYGTPGIDGPYEDDYL